MKLSSAPPILKHDAPPPPPPLKNVKKNCTFLLWRLPFLTSVCHITLINILFPRNFPTRNTFLSIPFYENFFDQKNFVELFFGKKLFFWAHSWAKELFWILFFSTFLRTFYLEHFLEGFFEHFLECACLTREPYFLETLFWVRTLFWALPWAI